MDIDVAALKEEQVGREFDEKVFDISADAVLEYATACGETEPRYTDPAHPDFQAPATYATQFRGEQIFPDSLSEIIAKQAPFDAGKRIEAHAPIRPGARITGRSQIHDVYEKTGRTGRMLFMVHRMTFTDEAGELVSIVDWRMVLRNVGG